MCFEVIQTDVVVIWVAKFVKRIITITAPTVARAAPGIFFRPPLCTRTEMKAVGD